MKRILYFVTAVAIGAGTASCMKEEIVNDTDVARHQIENLTATAGDEEVALSWTMPEGWEPTDYLITWNDADSQPQEVRTGGQTSYTVTDLVNDVNYTFNVQAVYGEYVSNIVYSNAKPVSSRITPASFTHSTDPDKEKQEQYIELTWEKPSELVLNYTLTYYAEMNPDNVTTETIGKDETSYKIEGVTNKDNYVINLVANYPKGPAAPAETKVWFIIAYYVSRTSAALGQSIEFRFNRDDYPTATDIRWTFPDGTVAEGEEATYVVSATGKKEVVLSADVNGSRIVWPAIQLDLREWVVGFNKWDLHDKAYTGFRGAYPVLSPDGKTVYVLPVMNFTSLVAFDVETGDYKWEYYPGSAVAGYNPPTVNPVTGDIYFGTTSANQFYCVDNTGKLKWTFTEAGSMKAAAPAVSADGTVVYISDTQGQTFAINATDGSKKWGPVALGAQSAGILVNNDDVIVAVKATDNTINFLNSGTGNKQASINLSNQATEMSGFAVADDRKTVYVPCKGGAMAKIDIQTRTLLKEAVIAANDMYDPIVASNGYIVVGSKDGYVYGIDGELTEKWKFNHAGGETPVASSLNYAHICANAQGHAYVVCGASKKGHMCYVLSAVDGSVAESFQYSTELSSYAMCGGQFHDGVFYYGTAGSSAPGGEFFGKYVGGTNKFWGGPGGDICGSGCIQSPLFQ